MKRPDLTKRQFAAECRRLGMVRTFGGYVYVTDRVAVFAANAGPRLRDQLAYLKREKDRAEENA